jgi:hypothetical protein
MVRCHISLQHHFLIRFVVRLPAIPSRYCRAKFPDKFA